MIREHLIKHHPARDGVFRWRGDGVSRIEGLSDAVFGFAITLLVVSLGAPRTFAELQRMIVGFPSFVATFAMIVMVWLAQYKFFRRYGLEDARTVRLNVVLLCVVVFFVYPLKFLFGTFIAMWLGPVGYAFRFRPLIDQMREAQAGLQPAQWPAVMIVFAAAYFAMFGVFALLHRHALACADELELDELERLETRRTIRENVVNMGVALLSVVVTLTVASSPAFDTTGTRHMGGSHGFGALLGGAVYATTGLFVSAATRGYRRRRQALLAARDAAPAVPERAVAAVPA